MTFNYSPVSTLYFIFIQIEINWKLLQGYVSHITRNNLMAFMGIQYCGHFLCGLFSVLRLFHWGTLPSSPGSLYWNIMQCFSLFIPVQVLLIHLTACVCVNLASCTSSQHCGQRSWPRWSMPSFATNHLKGKNIKKSVNVKGKFVRLSLQSAGGNIIDVVTAAETIN